MKRGDSENWLTPKARANVIRETFDNITAVGFTKWKAEELLGWGYEVGDEDRQYYFEEFEKANFADFQKMAEKATDTRLLDMRDEWSERANTMGLKEWQEVLSQGRGGQPFYDQLARENAAAEEARTEEPGREEGGVPVAEWGPLREEIARDEALRRAMWERGERADRPTSPKSVLGYDLAEPSPAPEQGQARGR